ncbi:MAG: hypothetical protein K0S53_674 [Bacteroidetes bacterium]|jgi:hypothetical protein|nr:hypothetical protein [Bacteroidota bacterium]
MNDPIVSQYYISKVDKDSMFNVRIISEEEFVRYTAHISALRKMSSDESLYTLVELNYNDLKNQIIKYESEFGGIHSISIPEFEKLMLNLNRLILNYLSAVRTYLDHTETRLKRTYGEKSNEMQNFKQYTNDAFDGYFSYRFLSKLRNYAQHCGLPSSSIEFSSTSSEGKIISKLIMHFERDELLNNFSSWGKLKEELGRKNQLFDVISLLEEKACLLKEINEKINSPIYLNHKQAGEELMSLIKESERHKGFPCIVSAVGNSTDVNFKMNWIPVDSVSKVTGLAIE